jgi:hypothetical protein
MGGNALKYTKTRRYSSSEFNEIWDKINSKLKTIGWAGRQLVAYRNKPDFGDMDILIENDGNLGDIKETIKREFHPNEIVKNGNVYSFNVDELQVDFIITPSIDMDSAFNFFAWNDLGNFIGKIGHKFGLKFGFSGLVYIYRTDNDSKILGEITLSKDPKKILPFLGFSYEEWERGFDNMEDIFEYIINSKYFNIKPFRFGELSATHKRRNKRRKMYNDFLAYHDEKILKGKYSDDGICYEFSGNKESYHEWINEEFPGFLDKLAEFRCKEEMRIEGRKKFNGDLVLKKYKITPKELGIAIMMFKTQFTNFDAYLYSTSEERIWKDFEKIAFNS